MFIMLALSIFTDSFREELKHMQEVSCILLYFAGTADVQLDFESFVTK